MTSSSSRQPPPIGAAELDIASTLINEANALLRQHGEDPGNDGTGDDLPVLTEVIFDLGEAATPSAPAQPKPGTPVPPAATQPAKPPTPALRQPVPPPRNAAAPPAPASAAQPPKPQVGATPSPRPATPHAQGTVATPAVAKPSQDAQPPKAQAGIPAAQRPAMPPVQPATTATAAPKPSPQATPATRMPPTQLLPQLQHPTAWFQSASPNAPAAKPAPKPQTTEAARPPVIPDPPVADQSPPPSGTPIAHMLAITEELKLLDTLIIGEVEAWLREELPALVVREISRLNERLRTEAIAHLRATLLPRISEHISGKIEDVSNAIPAIHGGTNETSVHGGKSSPERIESSPTVKPKDAPINPRS